MDRHDFIKIANQLLTRFEDAPDSADEDARADFRANMQALVNRFLGDDQDSEEDDVE